MCAEVTVAFEGDDKLSLLLLLLLDVVDLPIDADFEIHGEEGYPSGTHSSTSDSLLPALSFSSSSSSSSKDQNAGCGWDTPASLSGENTGTLLC